MARSCGSCRGGDEEAAQDDEAPKSALAMSRLGSAPVSTPWPTLVRETEFCTLLDAHGTTSHVRGTRGDVRRENAPDHADRERHRQVKAPLRLAVRGTRDDEGKDGSGEGGRSREQQRVGASSEARSAGSLLDWRAVAGRRTRGARSRQDTKSHSSEYQSAQRAVGQCEQIPAPAAVTGRTLEQLGGGGVDEDSGSPRLATSAAARQWSRLTSEARNQHARQRRRHEERWSVAAASVDVSTALSLTSRSRVSLDSCCCPVESPWMAGV